MDVLASLRGLNHYTGHDPTYEVQPVAVISENKYIQSLLQNLIATYETEVNYSPIEIDIDPKQINDDDIDTLLNFVSEERKRLFIFKITNNEQFNAELFNSHFTLVARRAVLSHTAETILKSTSSEPIINPLKIALTAPDSAVRAGVQIQKSFLLPKKPIAAKDSKKELNTIITAPDLVWIDIDLPELPQLTQQLAVLGIKKIHDVAAEQIKKHAHAFTDGIIPNNLPKGFYFNKDQSALCYTSTPTRLPSALAPELEKPILIEQPTVEQAKALLPINIGKEIITQLLNSKDSVAQKDALLHILKDHEEGIVDFLENIQPNLLQFIVPMLAKQFLLGGETHIRLLARLLNNCLNKKISIEFLKDPVVQNAFLNPRGIKNLQKLLQLPAEQKEWWNTLTNAHLKNNTHYFDFNDFFEAYTQIFLPRITEKNLTLPNPCPVLHEGHILVTLNRVLEVIEHSENPQEQCLSLDGLNWSPTGAHYAMTQAPENERLKQVTACMMVTDSKDTHTNPELEQAKMNQAGFDLKPWLFRYMGQNWNSNIRLTDINSQLDEVQKLAHWTHAQKNQLIFILTCTFSNKASLTPELWKATLLNCINLLNPLNEMDRNDLLEALSECYKFKPVPSLSQIQSLITQCLELKASFPTKNFKDELITPLISCFINEGYELINILQERIQKTDPNPTEKLFSLTSISSFTTLLYKNREQLHPELTKLLAKLNESELSDDVVSYLNLAIETLKNKKGPIYCSALLRTLSQLNISKSQNLPTAQQIQTLITTLSNSAATIPLEQNTDEKQDNWLKDSILEHNLLPGCVFGNGDISKLDDLIVDALVDAVKKRSAILDIDQLKASLVVHLQSKLVPDQLKEQLNQNLMPLLDAMNELIKLLLSSNPKFEDVIKKLSLFEEKKPLLLNAIYSVTILGDSKGEYLLSFILAGKRKENDNMTGSLFSAALNKLHSIIIEEVNNYFNDEKNRIAVRDLDANTLLSWLSAFNETHSLSFLFKEELVQKKVLPALKKTLLQLNTQDPIFENSILSAAADLSENEPADISLQNYKTKIESIAKYLNLLIDVKDKAPSQFIALYKQLQTGQLARLNYNQKQVIVTQLLNSQPESMDLYLKLTAQSLDEHPDANETDINRAIHGFVTLFEIPDLEAETQTMFFKMSMSHNLKSSSPFPLADLNEFKKCNLPEVTKSIIIRQTIQLLGHMTPGDSPDLIKKLVQQTQAFLTQNAGQSPLCHALLKKVSLENLSRDLGIYPSILHQMSLMSEDNRNKLSIILAGLANSKKDDTVDLPTLFDITRGLERRKTDVLDSVLKLFATPPYPIAQTLNTTLFDHGSEKLLAYCSKFDTNPFTKTGETRPLAKQFATDRVKEALLSLKDLMNEVELPHSLQLQFAKQLNYIETLGYTDPVLPNDYSGLKKLTASSRHDLKERASFLLNQIRDKVIPENQLELTQLELLAYLREIYFRATGLFPNTTQMLMLLIAFLKPDANLLMSIKTGEGKSLITPMLSVLQWAQGGTVDVCTANRTLLARDYENNCEPFFKFLGIESALIQSNSSPEEYKLNGINCSTLEDMSLFRLAAKESRQEHFIQNENPTHIVLDECDDGLLDQSTLYKLVAETQTSNAQNDNPAQWIYPLAYQFTNLPAFRNTTPSAGKVWDEEEDLEQFRLYLNKQINEIFHGDANKQNYLMASSNTELRQWINASCKAATLVENKHFIVQTLKEKDSSTNETRKKMVCVPLSRSTPKTGCIFTNGLQQALQARLIAERTEQAHYFSIDADPPVLASQSARGLMQYYQETNGRLLGISGTPGDPTELKYLTTLYGTQAIGVAPYAGDKRTKHAPIFTFSNEETIQAIHKAIESVQLPITQAMMSINPNIPTGTSEQKEAFILRKNEALEQWNNTQTQPISIICEDFDEAQTLGNKFNIYKEAGFNVQVVTGKESPEKLALIIKQAGRANTITIGTAMLARGIDVNPGDHPEGLFVIQTYPDSKRMTTQIGGRAARNGKPGQWLPIYQVKPPEHWFSRILYYIFPFYRKNTNLEAIEQLQTEINLQATIDRLYTQAVDQAQHTLMQQIQSWESLLLEIYPEDPKLRFELYQWRETLLSELTHVQEAYVSQETLNSSIEHFKNSLGKLWDRAKEEKWCAKAKSADNLSPDQTLKLNYLMHLDFAQELNIQSSLVKQSLPLKEGTKALMHQNLDAMIQDKAGAVLDYTIPSAARKIELELAQARQLLPGLIGELCGLNPQAIKKFNSNNSNQSSYYLPEALMSLLEHLIEQKNKALSGTDVNHQITQEIIQFYNNELKEADSNTIQLLLEQIKPLIINHSHSLTSSSLINRFKMQGLILTFSKIYQNSGLAADQELEGLKISFDKEIMKTLANHLMNELAWIKASPQPLHAFFERTVAKEAAHAIYDLAEEVSNAPNDEVAIHALYTGLQEQRVILEDKFMFSIHHTTPRNVINMALEAIESLNMAPHCDRDFQTSCHDAVLAKHHLKQFFVCLEETSESLMQSKDSRWEYVYRKLEKIADQRKENQNHIIFELHEAVERFSHYDAYQSYSSELSTLKSQLASSLEALSQSNGLKQDYQSSLIKTKQSELTTLFNVDANQINIQSGTDGINSFIEVQVENSQLIEGFVGYESPSLKTLENEKTQLAAKKSDLKNNKKALKDLTDVKACEVLSSNSQTEFKRLFKLKELLATVWDEDFDVSLIQDLNKPIDSIVDKILQIEQWNWEANPVDLEALKLIIKPDQDFIEKLDKQTAIKEKLGELQKKLGIVNKQISEKELKISLAESRIRTINERMEDPKCGIADKFSLGYERRFTIPSELASLNGQINEYRQEITNINHDSDAFGIKLNKINQSLDNERASFTTSLLSQAKLLFDEYLHKTSKNNVRTLRQELKATDATLVSLSNAESSKSRYQTHRFFSSSELLKFEASLAKEEELIPKLPINEQVEATVHEDLVGLTT